jgi:hypothetical protein
MEGEFEPRRGDVLSAADRGIAGREIGMDFFCFGREGFPSFDNNAGAQLLPCAFGHLPFDLGPIGAVVSVLRIEEFGVESGFVGEKEESFAVTVETSERVDVWWKTKFGEGTLSGVVGRELGEDAVGLVEGEKHQSFLATDGGR